MMQRRTCLQHLTLGASLLGWGGPLMAQVAPRKRLMVVILRGAVDGLSVVAPYSEAAYYKNRSSIALAKPGSEGGGLDLDGHFGLHPALAPLLPLWQAGKLGFVHASGSPDTTRSHFDAQDYLESATPGRKSTPDGWLNRLLGVLPVPQHQGKVTRALALGPVMPRIFAGPHSVASLAAGRAANRPGVLDKPNVGKAFDALYGADGKLDQTYQTARQSRAEVMQALQGVDLDKEMLAASNGAPLPNGFVQDATHIAQLLRSEPSLQLVCTALGGWDTHANQGAANGQLAQRLQPLGQGLAQLAQRLGPALDDTLILVMSEFGRTVRQNGNGGTDHGHGNVMWLLGGGLGAACAGKVAGRWPGLDDAALYEGRDLDITTDYRSVLAAILQQHLRLPDTAISTVLPGFSGAVLPGILKA